MVEARGSEGDLGRKDPPAEMCQSPGCRASGGRAVPTGGPRASHLCTLHGI